MKVTDTCYHIVKKIFEETNTIITNGHFVYSKKSDGWYHGPDYVNKDAIYTNVFAVKLLCGFIAREFLNENVETIVGPTVGGAIMSQWIAYYLNNKYKWYKEKGVSSVFADEVEVSLGKELLGINNGGRVIKRGYDKFVKGKRCLLVEDVVSSGATVCNTHKAVLGAGGQVIGVGALCNRSGGKVTAKSLCVPKLFSLVDLKMEMFKEENCPICKEKGVESVNKEFGKGKEFLKRIGKL